MPAFFNSTVYTWVLLPILIFCARILDVSLDTVRIIFINRNLKYYVAFTAFFAVLIWLMVIRQIFHQLDNPVCYLAYAAGYATGNFVGMIIENKISIGKVIIRAIVRMEAEALVAILRSTGYGVTAMDAEGTTGPVKIVFTIVERSDIKNVVEIIREHNPSAFYSIEDVRMVSESVTPFRLPATPAWSRFTSIFRNKEH
jgi:uncharacterized protein YebE (UPF0316 family)